MLYHLTNPKNLPTIITRGIIPDYKKGIGRIKHGYVFLTNDVERIIETQLGRNYWKEVAIIHIDTDNFKPFIYQATNLESDFEFVSDYVSPKCIKKIEYIKL